MYIIILPMSKQWTQPTIQFSHSLPKPRLGDSYVKHGEERRPTLIPGAFSRIHHDVLCNLAETFMSQ
jgi:threonyl-tRNA synthetase